MADHPSTIQGAIEELTKDDDLSFEQFQAYLKEVTNRWTAFYRQHMDAEEPDFPTAATKGVWMDDFNAFVETMDGEHADQPETES